MKNTTLLFFLLLTAGSLSAQNYNLTVLNGYGGGTFQAGDTVYVWSKEWPLTRTFSHWSGDTSHLLIPGEWRSELVMPAQDITLEAHLQDLPAAAPDYFHFETIQGFNIMKPVYTYFPASGEPDAVVWLWHGTGGDAVDWIFEELPMRYYCDYLIANNYALVVTESDESTMNMDLNGDGAVRYDYQADSTNVDFNNVLILRDTFIQRGWMSAQTPQVAAGFSAGGAFSVALAAAFEWKAAITHNNPGGGYAQSARSPILFSMSQFDNHVDVGMQGNLDAYANYEALLDTGQCADYIFFQPYPLYPERFRRIPGVSDALSESIYQELVVHNCVGPAGFLTKSPTQIENMVLNNPASWPVIVGLLPLQRDNVQYELAVTYTTHRFSHDYMGREVRFLKELCGTTPTNEPMVSTEVFRVYPNPARDFLMLPEATGRLRVVNSHGNPVLEKTLDSNMLEIHNWPAGIYFLEWQDGTRRQQARWVKM